MATHACMHECMQEVCRELHICQHLLPASPERNKMEICNQLAQLSVRLQP